MRLQGEAMKRVRVFETLISDNNLKIAIETVCKSHRWVHFPNKRNKTTVWLEETINERIQELKNMIINGFEPSPVTKKRRYDVNAGKWRDISEPRLYPDQCVHHAFIQALEPVMMRGMDKWCCGSIKSRGMSYGIDAIKKWMKRPKGSKWCIEMDIHHFYDSLEPARVVGRMRRLIKDRKTLDLIERVTKDGILIGAFCSQWFANVFLQPLDLLIRQVGATHYIRYMDNFTVFTDRKRTADKIIKATQDWLENNGLKLKGNVQKFSIYKRAPNAMGYRFFKGYTLIRKKTLLRTKRQLKRFYQMRERAKYIPVKFAQGLLSRLGLFRRCNCFTIYRKYVKKHTQRHLKDIVRKELYKWKNMYSGTLSVTA